MNAAELPEFKHLAHQAAVAIVTQMEASSSNWFPGIRAEVVTKIQEIVQVSLEDAADRTIERFKREVSGMRFVKVTGEDSKDE